MSIADPMLGERIARIEATLTQHAEYVHEALEDLKECTAEIKDSQEELKETVATTNSRVDVMQNETVWMKRALMAVGAVASPATMQWLGKFLGL